MADRLASGLGFNPQNYVLKNSAVLTDASVSGSFVGTLDGSISGSSVMTASALNLHANTSGSSVHGLGTISIQNANNVNITGGSFLGTIMADNIPTNGLVLAYNNGSYMWANPNAGAMEIQGDWNAETNVPDLVTGGSAIITGHTWRVSASGTTALGSISTWTVNDLAVKTPTDWIKVQAGLTAVSWGMISGSIASQLDLQQEFGTKEDISNKNTSTSLGTSNTLYPTQNAVKTYVDTHINASGSNVHGLGTISTQSASNVNISGGTISGTFTGTLDGSISGSSVATNQLLENHQNTTGSLIHGLGTISTQNESSVSITGGTINNITGSNISISGSFTGNLTGSISGSSVITGSALALHESLSGSSVHGLGTLSTQNANNVSITGGSISGSMTGLVDLSNKGVKDNFVSTPLSLGDVLNTSFGTDNKTIVGAVNEVNNALSYLSAGVTGTVATLLDNNNGTATISAVDVLLYDNPNFVNTIRKFTISGSTFSFTDGSEEYIAVSYNSGSPVMYKETIDSNITSSDVIRLFTCWRQGTIIHSLGFDALGNGLSNKNQDALLHSSLYRIDSEGGLIISETTSPNPRTIVVTGATVYTGAVSQVVNPFNSSTDNMTFVYHVAGNWTYTNNNLVYNNLQYDDGTNLASLSGKWGVMWFYRSIGDVKQLFYVPGSASYSKSSDAELENPRTDLSLLLKKHCILVGRAIIKGGEISGYTQSAFGIMFTGTNVINHNDTNNIQGGTTDQYYHLNSSQYTNVGNLASMAYQSASGVSITGGTLSGVSGNLTGSISGSSVVTNTALVTHSDLSGSSVHGLGTISTQNANNVSITGGSFSGVSLSGTLTGNATLNVLKTGDTVTGSLVISDNNTGYALAVSQTNTSGSILRAGTATDNITIRADGSLIMSGTAIVWNDIPPLPLINARNGGGNQPLLTAIQGNVQALTFTIGDYVYSSFELLHEYKEGSDIEAHIHWANQSSDTTVRGVKWELEYTVSNLSNSSTPPFANAFPASVIISKEIQIPANTPVKTHIYTDIGIISGVGLKIGTYILWRLRRIAATVTPAAPASNPYGLALGTHIQQNSIGSSTEHTK